MPTMTQVAAAVLAIAAGLSGGGGGGGSGVAVGITTQLDAGRVLARLSKVGGGQNLGQATTVMALSFTGTQPIYCRRRSFSDGVTILQAAWLANASANTGSILLTGIDVPGIAATGATPVVANDGWFYLDVATAPSGPWTNATSQVTAGRVIMATGQSLAVRKVARQDSQTATNASLGIVISPYTSVLATYNETRAYLPTIATMPWAPPADGGNYDSTHISEFTRRQVQLFGCPVGMIGHSRGAQPLSTFASGGAEATTWLAPVIAKAGGAFEACMWYQGHTEAQWGVPPGGYSQALTQLFTYFATLSSTPFTKYVGSIPNINNALWGTPWCRHWIRRGHEVWAAANSAVHTPYNDIDLVDGVHQTQVGAVTMAQHDARATKTELSLRADVGPALVSATRVAAVIVAVFSDVGQGNLVLTGTPGNLIYVFPTGRVDRQGNTNNRYPVSAVVVTNKTTLTITLTTDPGDAPILDMWIYWANDSTSAGGTNNIRDDIVDGDGIAVGRQIVPNNVALVIPAPGSITTNNPPGGLIAAVSQFTMTETATTYGAQEQTGFNGTLNGGTAITAGSQNFKWPTFNPYSVHFWFTAPTVAPVATQVIVGGFPNFIAITTAMKIQFNGSSSVVMTAGHRYHVCCIGGPTGHFIYMTDVTAAGAGTLVYSDATPSVALPAAANIGFRNLNGGNVLVAAGATQDEVAIFDFVYYTGPTYTAPTVPFTGFETGCVAHYNVDANCVDSVCA